MKNTGDKTYNRQITAYLSLLVLFISHIITMVSLYPGICYYDIGTQIDQYTSKVFNTSHPLLHTLFIGYFSQHYEGNTGFAIATVIQIVIVDLAISYMLLYIFSRTRNLLSHIFFVCFFAFMPMCSFLTISHTKDILFAAFALIFVIDMIRYHECDIRYNALMFTLFRIRMVVNIILMLLLRNNATYAYAAMLIIMILRFFLSKRGNPSGHLLIVLAIALVLTFISNSALIRVTNANSGSIKEMMSIPSQIMARIYNTDATDEEKDIILQYIPSPEDYEYYLSDHIKMQLDFDTLDSECKHFLLDSAILALHHPGESAKAVWYNIQGYFDPLHCPYSSEHFYLVALAYRGGAVLSPKWLPVFDFYQKWFYQSEALSHSPFYIFFNMAIYIWIYILSLIFNVRKRGLSGFTSYLFPLLYLGTLLLGPGAIIRYGFLYILLLPIACMNMRH